MTGSQPAPHGAGGCFAGQWFARQYGRAADGIWFAPGRRVG